MTPIAADDRSLNWELAAESIVLKIRWFGIAMGLILVQTRSELRNPDAVRAFLALGASYALLDTIFYRMGEVFLKRVPLFVSAMEALFIALLCYHDTGLESPFRWYYLLSSICCALRFRPMITWLTFGFHCLSFASLAWMIEGSNFPAARGYAFTIVILAWLTWAGSALSGLLRGAYERLKQLNADLERSRGELEERVAERSSALRASQARLIHQEKMAAFGLLAAGIAHEVGNPLAAVSSLIQMLKRRRPDDYTAEKLDLVAGQVGRIQRTIRELIDFSRPTATEVVSVRLGEVVDEALGVAKYYQRTKDRAISTAIDPAIPPIRASRDHIQQIILNLVMNAIDATNKGGAIAIEAGLDEGSIVLSVTDDGRGIAIADRCRIFQPYFTTKPQGTGLGLYISRQIVEELGGTLNYHTEEGRGTKFIVRIPVDREIEGRDHKDYDHVTNQAVDERSSERSVPLIRVELMRTESVMSVSEATRLVDAAVSPGEAASLNGGTAAFDSIS